MSAPASSSTRSSRSISARRPFVAIGNSGDRYVGDTVIIATGAQARWLGRAERGGLPRLWRIGLRDLRRVFLPRQGGVVVGGGNTAVEEAIYLTNHARPSDLVHRRNTLRAEKILQDRLFRNPKIDVVWDSVVDEILGVPEPPQVTGVRLRNMRTGAVTERACDGVFIAIGHTPVTGLVAGQLPLDAEGYILTAARFDSDRDSRASSPPATSRTRCSARR